MDRYLEFTKRINSDMDERIGKTGAEFKTLVKDILHGASVTGTGLEKVYRKALGEDVPSAFWKKYEKDLKKVLKPELLHYFYYEIDNVRAYQFDTTVYRRNFRSRDYRDYVKVINNIFRDFARFSVLDVDMCDYLLEKVSEDHTTYKNRNNMNFPYVIGAMIDSGDERIIETLTDIVMNSAGSVNYGMIRGIYLSQNENMYILMEKLLLAARLQEGLRQSICENMDFGTIEAFRHMFKVILDNDLLRFSSIQRAVETCVGLLAYEEKGGDRLGKKQAALIEELLNDPASREKYLSSNDHMEIYLALWAIASTDVDTAFSVAERYIMNGTREQSLTSTFFLARVSYDSSVYLKILREKKDQPDIVAQIIPNFMERVDAPITKTLKKEDGGYREYVFNRVYVDPGYYFNDEKEAREAYLILKDIHDGLPAKKVEFTGLVFPWNDLSLTRTDLMTRMVFCASAARDRDMMLEVARQLSSVEKWTRERALALLLNEPENKEEYELLTKAAADGEEFTRNRAGLMLNHELERDTTSLEPDIRAPKGKLPDFCYSILEDQLKSKRSDIRQNAITLLLTMDDDKRLALIERLLSDKTEERHTAGLDIILSIKKDNPSAFADAAKKTSILTSPSTKEQVLIDEIVGSADSPSLEPVDSLFDTEADYEPVYDPEFLAEANAVWDRLFPNKTDGSSGIKRALSKIKPALSKKSAESSEELRILQALDDYIYENKDVEFTRLGEKCLVGNGVGTYFENGKRMFPCEELWDSFYKKEIKTEDELLRVTCLLSYNHFDHRINQVRGYKEFCNIYIDKYLGSEFCLKDLPQYRYMRFLNGILANIIERHDLSDAISKTGCAITYVMVTSDDPMIYSFTKDDVVLNDRDRLINEKFERTPFLAAQLRRFIAGMKNTAETFPFKYALNRKFDGDLMKDATLRMKNFYYPSGNDLILPTVGEYIHACAAGIISKDLLYKRIFDGCVGEAFSLLSSLIVYIRENGDTKSTRVRRYGASDRRIVAEFFGRRDKYTKIEPESLTDLEKKELSLSEELYDTLVRVCVGKELRRGDTATEYTDAMKNVGRLYGLDNFVNILKAFGKSTFNRSLYMAYGSVNSKEDVLSHLLAVCVPDEREGNDVQQAAKLGELIMGTDIKEKRLIEAALFSPEWLDIIGEYLKIDGFRSGCYYFMAHMNERFDDKRKASIAKFSPISEEEFREGAFDKTWFDEVYSVLGEKTFNVIYDAAKYISDGAKHARARKYADAATGRLDPAKTLDEIIKKRNKDLLMAYAIMPGTDKEIRDRYSYIRQYIKESKQFGAQRRASEKLAGEMAIKNMATSQGYTDETRFILKMENEIASELAGFWNMHSVGDYDLGLSVDSGKIDIVIQKDGKVLKSLPASIKKDEYVLDIQEAKKTFTEQYRRTRLMFEEAMESRSAFSKAEIDALKANPVLTDMIDTLIFEANGRFGLWKDLNADKNDEVYVAHSYSMFKAGVWKDIQALIYENEIIQPFKQVFRELYVKTDEEMECYDSRRYAGNQIQTKMTMAVLKGRRWIADIEEGLQKVYYKENIIATIYALADWFSPSDIEAPTLEWVAFYDRKSGQAMKIADVPDILFSEVMRDVDLAVSVAHAGEVDPEMSHSTIEMRHVIAEFAVKSFRLKNVSFTDSHALIKGTRGNYTVHLGSGIIHMEAGPMINVLPVHSQKRGRIFLPFVDDDPKTAEIITKILMFAEDSKIKDPLILNQM